MFKLALSVRGASAIALQAVSERLFPGVLPDFFTQAYDIERRIGSSPAAAGARSVTWAYWREGASLSEPCPRPNDTQVFSWPGALPGQAFLQASGRPLGLGGRGRTRLLRSRIASHPWS